jgi:hypothetical protein
MIIFQPNYERNPIEEMRAAEIAGKFHYIPPGVGMDDKVSAPVAQGILQPTSGTDRYYQNKHYSL